MNEFDETEEEYDDGRPHPMYKLGKHLGRAIVIISLLVTALIFFRMCSQNKIPDSVNTLSVNDSLRAAYAQGGNSLSVIYQDYEIYSTENKVRVNEEGKLTDNAGKAYFAVPQALIIPDANQIQLVLRYNNSTLKYLAQDYRELCPDVPDRSEDVYDVTLVKITDLTPNISTDNEDGNFITEERFFVTDSVSAESGLHNFRRLTFENVNTENVLKMYICIYYKGAVDYDAPPYATVTIYESGERDHVYTLTKSDIAAIEGRN